MVQHGLGAWVAQWPIPRGTGGFTVVTFGHEPTPEVRTWKSTEHNTDLAAGLAFFAIRTGEFAGWRDKQRLLSTRKYDVGSGMPPVSPQVPLKTVSRTIRFWLGCPGLAFNGPPRSGREIAIGNYYRRTANECRRGLFLR